MGRMSDGWLSRQLNILSGFVMFGCWEKWWED